MRIILVSILAATFFVSLPAAAQMVCATSFNPEAEKKSSSARYNRFLKLEQHTNQFRLSEKTAVKAGRLANPNNTIIIPVVVHILHYGEPVGTGRNIPDAQVQSQIDVLNEDFRRLNADRVNTPAAFAGVAADPNFEFRLACIDPNGNPTNGINRVQTAHPSYSIVAIGNEIQETSTRIKFRSEGGEDAWATNTYLNIWVCNIAPDPGGQTMGYAQFPFDYNAKPNTDGVVVHYRAFGRNSGSTFYDLASGFGLGRVATHEVGHWLNLYHIFGPDSGCTNDDFCNDTPIQAVPNGGCPSFPNISCSNGPNGDMFMNYMDYTSNACMNIFTQGQRTRMRAIFASGGERYSFINNYFRIKPTANAICSTGSTLSVSNPACLNVTWTIVSGPLSIASGQGTNTITLNKTGDGVAVIRATAGGYIDELTIQAGIQTPTNIAGLVPPLGVFPGELLELEAEETAPAYSWSAQGGNILGYDNQKRVTIQVDMCSPFMVNGWLNVQLFYTNACGVGSYGEFTTIDCPIGGPFMISPNPASGQLSVTGKEKEIREIQLIDKNGNLRKHIRLATQQKNVRLNITDLKPDIYSIRIFDGKNWTTRKLIIK
ncbi:M43 family zinc metalloprotease [Pseudobacter ginsenosidimutans]|uniref:Putative secreted protein (Por secretion system target) n=1 Tax=Pseudobacter ginsenosidimutans TaxID=661488 RepID=A0A4Q7MZG6_9BACT|nr:M43 family zinc metalloprotease [Pseudobacter ginsenosidimutans]RZS72600.1 putative secreted protein (Por secretion system target) [Pseudobacter ginsenosidimutans]